MATKTRGKGEGSLYLDNRGFWTAVVELPGQDGKRRRKWVRSKTKTETVRKLREIQGDLDRLGDLPTADMTVGAWFTYWFENIAVREVKPKAAAGYRTVTYKHIIPTIGKLKMSKVTPTHLRRVEDHIVKDLCLSPTYALNIHRVMSSAFEQALREGKISRNPAKQMAAPRRRRPELEAFTLEESIQVLGHVIVDETYGARWATSLLTGARRGEVIGIEADRVGGKDDIIDLSWQLQRLVWEHGCGEGRYVGDKRVWPCGHGQGNTCPDRQLRMPSDYEVRRLTNGLYLTRPKSVAGTRVVPLVDPLRAIIGKHMVMNPPDAETGLIFPWRDRPADPDQDTARWSAVLAETGIPKHVRLHDLRHTAIDLMTLAGVPDDVIMQIVGHAERATTNAYKSRNLPRLRLAMQQMAAPFLDAQRGVEA